ncbi:hypothetical protein [Pseudomonas chlororaphis]|uniref:hypothetical protein n=1 Tax=Pseudomonas chlororaphis TaxID=587753 RepID=UPI0004B3EBCB|nr:hypothetical protein [Pseudomonas chlororaphis]
MNKKIRNLVLSYMLVSTGTIYAHELYNSDQGVVDFNLEVTTAPFYSSFDYASRSANSVKWTESYIRSGFSGTRPAFGGDFYGSLGVMTSKVLGDRNAAGTSSGHEYRSDFDSAFMGWRNPVVDISFGRQAYIMGDGFLIAGDQLNYGENSGHGFNRGGLYYLSPRSSFAQTVIARLRPLNPLLIEGFHIESNNNGQGSPHLDGLNTEYAFDAANVFGLSYLRVNNVDARRAEGLFALRKGLDVYNLRGKSNLGVDSLSLEAGYAAERSDRVDAYAWYGAVSYRFAHAPLGPVLGYRYSRFSGDNPSTRKSEAFDPLFYGSLVGNPAWVQGEIAGTFAGPFNTNTKVHRLSARTTLNEKVAIGAMAYRFESERSSDRIGDELDLYLETFPTANLTVVPVLGIWKPQQGAKAQYGDIGVQTFATVMVSFIY